ncbi:EscU/YscU/HrcU family type III secretion system export apparatus switch protein [Schlesneria paludicola]|uniref:EscU/YscU/HrcU family type III secretion system export apparatus switch protein n=1 Tax=Schlesneria paludicola TaxID=360056 RepID=UPI00029A22B3|nr:EscU/YscU/HrcU family type III secretion system export apparatus switch protein [Schlesneria paludicola]
MFQDDLAERTLPPTERRRREARARGEVARSPELTAAVILLAFCGLIRTLGFGCATTLAALMRSAISGPPALSLNTNTGAALLTSALQTMAELIAPILLLLLICGLLTNLIQTGLLWTPAILLPRFRLGGLGTGLRLGDAIRQVAKLLALGITLWWSLSSLDWQYRTIGASDTLSMLVLPAENIITVCFALAFVLLLFAALDYGLKFWHLHERLKMTIDERRSEQREEELDPRIKRRLRAGRATSEITGPSRIE